MTHTQCLPDGCDVVCVSNYDNRILTPEVILANCASVYVQNHIQDLHNGHHQISE